MKKQTRLASTRSWLSSAMIYHIFLDRFSRGIARDHVPGTCNEPVFFGGNLRGVIERLDYLEDLGVNTLLLSPFNSTASYHGYHTTDLYAVDPRFGSLDTLQELITSAHSRGMRILMDLVPNHVHKTHPLFIEAQNDSRSEKRQWFYFIEWPTRYLRFLEVDELPKLNLDYGPARQYMIDVALFWLKQGFDGFRLDHAIGPSHDFWRAFRGALNGPFPDAVLIGEATLMGMRFRHLKTIRMPKKHLAYLFARLGRDLAMRQYVGVLDGVLDFELQKILKNWIARKRWYRPHWLLDRIIKAHYARFPADFCLPSFLDNHDMNRFLFEANQSKDSLKRAASVQFAQSQPPIIYYGTEVGLSQERTMSSSVPHSDLLARRPMPWMDQDADLHSFFRELILERQRRASAVGEAHQPIVPQGELESVV